MSRSKPATQEARATKAFLSSGGYDFNGSSIKPFTPQRQAVASEMGMTWPWINDADTVTLEVPIKDKKITITHYRQSYKDSLIALWLCSQNESRVDRAERKPDEAMTEAWAWAKKIGFNQSSTLAGEGLTLWIQMTNEIAESRAEAIPKHKPGEEDSPNEGEL